MKNNHTLRWRCCVCGRDAELHEVAKGGNRVPYGIRHHLQLPLCREHHDVAHGKDRAISGEGFETVWFDFLHGKDQYGACMFFVRQRNHAELEKTDYQRLQRLMEYSE